MKKLVYVAAEVTNANFRDLPVDIENCIKLSDFIHTKAVYFIQLVCTRDTDTTTKHLFWLYSV